MYVNEGRYVSKGNVLQVGRIPGLERFGRFWVIPADAEKPTDPRRNTRINAGKETTHADKQ